MSDEVMRELLREHYERVDPVPDRLRTAALGAFAWRDVDRELAELQTDSLLTDAAIRSQGGSRLLTFDAGPQSIEIEVDCAGRRRQIVGQIVPPAAGVVRLRTDDRVAARVDALGRFLFADVPAGRFSLTWEPAGGSACNTAWIGI